MLPRSCPQVPLLLRCAELPRRLSSLRPLLVLARVARVEALGRHLAALVGLLSGEAKAGFRGGAEAQCFALALGGVVEAPAVVRALDAEQQVKAIAIGEGAFYPHGRLSGWTCRTPSGVLPCRNFRACWRSFCRLLDKLLRGKLEVPAQRWTTPDKEKALSNQLLRAFSGGLTGVVRPLYGGAGGN